MAICLVVSTGVLGDKSTCVVKGAFLSAIEFGLSIGLALVCEFQAGLADLEIGRSFFLSSSLTSKFTLLEKAFGFFGPIQFFGGTYCDGLRGDLGE